MSPCLCRCTSQRAQIRQDAIEPARPRVFNVNAVLRAVPGRGLDPRGEMSKPPLAEAAGAYAGERVGLGVQLALKQRNQSRVIDCPVHIALFNERTARGLGWLSDFHCRRGAKTGQALRGVHEVEKVLDNLYAGRDVPTEVVVAHDDQDAPISLAVVRMDGDAMLTREPYIEAIARHDQFRRAVLRDRSTSAAGAAMRGVLDMLALHYGPANLPSVTARLLPGNVRSHNIFTQANFAALPRAIPGADQIIYQRPSRIRLPHSLDPSVYVPPTRPSVRRLVFRQTVRDSPELGRNDPCWCGSGKKLKKCHGA